MTVEIKSNSAFVLPFVDNNILMPFLKKKGNKCIGLRNVLATFQVKRVNIVFVFFVTRCVTLRMT